MYHKTTLDNGLRVVTANLPHTRSIAISIFIGVGSRYETEAQGGISHFIEHMCFKGTAKRQTSKDISQAIEGVGGILNGGTNKELTIYWSKVAQPHFALALDVLVDMLLHPRLDASDLEQERQVIVEEINMTKDSPQQLVDALIDELLWPNHPLGRDVAGTKESVTGITRDMMVEYLSRRYQPDNTVISIAGNISREDAIATVSQTIGDWKNKQPRSSHLAYREQPNPRLRIEKKDTEQAHLCLALPGLSLMHPQRFTLDLLNVILGEGMSSRLFTEIRDKLGLAYSISSTVDHLSDTGAVIIYAGVETKKLSIAVKAIIDQLSLLREKVPEAELSRAKEFAKGRLLLRMEDSYSVASWMGGQEILTKRILTVDEVAAIIDQISQEDLSRLATELMVGSQLRLAMVGPITDPDPLAELLKL